MYTSTNYLKKKKTKIELKLDNRSKFNQISWEISICEFAITIILRIYILYEKQKYYILINIYFEGSQRFNINIDIQYLV